MPAKEQVEMCSAAGVQQIRTDNCTTPGEEFKEPPRSKFGGVGAKRKHYSYLSTFCIWEFIKKTPAFLRRVVSK